MSVLFLCLWLSLPQQSPPSDLPPEAVTLLHAGADAERRGDFDTAVSDFQKAAELAPNYPAAFLQLGNAYMQKRHYADAIPPLKKALQLNPELLPAHQLLGFALLARGYAAEAIPHFEAAHEFGALGIAQLQNDQPGEAVENLQRALQKNPGDPDLLFYLVKAGSALSAQALDQLLSTYPDSPRGHQAIGQSYYSMKMYEQAAKEYNKALSIRPDLPGLRMELGQVYADSSQWDKAEEQFRAEAELQPGNPEVAYRLGNALLEQGKMKEAVAELRRSDELRPGMPETLYLLGKGTAASDPATAEKSLARVTELEKDSALAAQAYLLLAGIHRKQGKTELAGKEMQEFRRIESLTGARARGNP